jgi:hypothetical protein
MEIERRREMNFLKELYEYEILNGIDFLKRIKRRLIFFKVLNLVFLIKNILFFSFTISSFYIL